MAGAGSPVADRGRIAVTASEVCAVQICQRCALVPFSAATSADDLLGGRPVHEVFTAAERRYNSRTRSLATVAGRIAAKSAILDLLELSFGVGGSRGSGMSADTPWNRIEILPGRHGVCADPEACHGPHRPVITLHAPLTGLLTAGEHLTVSISHSAAFAVALAVRAPLMIPARAGRDMEGNANA